MDVIHSKSVHSRSASSAKGAAMIVPEQEKRVTAIVIGVFAAILFVVAATTLPSRFMMLSDNATLEKLLNNEKASDQELDDLIREREYAAAIRNTGETMDDLVAGYLTRAQREGLKSDEGVKDLQQALDWQKKALGQAPADSYGWMQLAYLLLQTEGIRSSAVEALKRSIETNPYEPRMMVSRLNMTIMLMDLLDDNTKSKIPDMVRVCWKAAPQELAKASRENNYISIVESALLDDERALNTFHNLQTSLARAEAKAKPASKDVVKDKK